MILQEEFNRLLAGKLNSLFDKKFVWSTEASTVARLENPCPKILSKIKYSPNVGLEPTTVGLRVQRSTD